MEPECGPETIEQPKPAEKDIAPRSPDEPHFVSEVKALFGNARFVGEVLIERKGGTVMISGKRVGWGLYWLRFWSMVVLVGSLALPPVQELGATVLVNVLAVILLLAVGGRLVLIGTARRETVTFQVTTMTVPSVGLRVRGLHLVLIGFSGLAALVVFALYPGGRRTVSLQADDGEGGLARYLFMARDSEQAIRLAAALLP